MIEQEQLDTEVARRLVENPDWKWAKGKLETILTIYNTVGTLDYKLSDAALAKQVRLRKDVVALLQSFMDEIEGTALTAADETNTNTTLVRM